ncbi:hypothetical protein DPEC_G00361900 [Dallia pectoralis]|nr:hypothetical protein DPEC_G00361900 [Dallia pectoralis]
MKALTIKVRDYIGLPPKSSRSCSEGPISCGVIASGCDLSLLNRSDTSNMTYAEQTDSYWCSRCNLNIFVFDPDDTFLTQHAYLTRERSAPKGPLHARTYEMEIAPEILIAHCVIRRDSQSRCPNPQMVGIDIMWI